MDSKFFRNAAVAVGMVASAAVASAPVTSHAAEVTPAAVTQKIDPKIAAEVDARLKLLVPIVKGAEKIHLEMNMPEKDRALCSAQTLMFARAMVAFKSDQVYSREITKTDVEDLKNMARFATCTLPGGLKATLSVCSVGGMSLIGALIPDTFDPAKMDVRPLSERCPDNSQPVKVSRLNNG